MLQWTDKSSLLTSGGPVLCTDKQINRVLPCFSILPSCLDTIKQSNQFHFTWHHQTHRSLDILFDTQKSVWLCLLCASLDLPSHIWVAKHPQAFSQRVLPEKLSLVMLCMFWKMIKEICYIPTPHRMCCSWAWYSLLLCQMKEWL